MTLYQFNLFCLIIRSLKTGSPSSLLVFFYSYLIPKILTYN